MNWLNAITKLQRDNVGFVLVTVLETKGSAPRDCAAKMAVTDSQIYDSIGGGNLEYHAINTARELLTEADATPRTETFSLGKDLTQCCGGEVVLLFECFPACAFNLVLFGAGHVGSALIKILSALPCRVRWLDSRADIFPETVADNVETATIKNPFAAVESCPPNALYLIMTHSHETDFELCEAVLSRTDITYCGLIGSKSKAAKFKSRLHKKGYTETETTRLTCPVGLQTIRGKTPMEVAVSIAAQLLELRGQHSQL